MTVAAGSVLVLTAASLVATVPAQAAVLDGINYVISNGSAVVGTGNFDPNSLRSTGCDPNADCPSQITIPATVSIGNTEYDVTAIAGKAFYDRAEVQSVDLSQAAHLTTIGLQAFYQSDNTASPHGPSSVSLGFGVQTIDNMAFCGTALQHLDIPAGVTTVGPAAFSFIPELTTVQIGSQVTSIGNAAFAADAALTDVRFLGTKPTFSQGVFGGGGSAALRYKHQFASTWVNLPDESPSTWVDTDAPAVSTQPQARTVFVGQSATFAVAGSGNGGVSYQWRRNGIDIDDANNSSLVVANPDRTNSGANYSVVLTNWAGSTESTLASLTVKPKGTQSIRFNLPRVLLRNHGYPLPLKTVQGTPLTWAGSRTGACTIVRGHLVCQRNSGPRVAALVARAGQTAAWKSFVQTVSRPVR